MDPDCTVMLRIRLHRPMMRTMKQKLSLKNLFALIPLAFLALCALFLGCGSGGGGSSNDDDDDSTPAPTTFTRDVEVVLINNSSNDVRAFIEIWDETNTAIDFFDFGNSVISAGDDDSQIVRGLESESVSIPLSEIRVSTEPPPATDDDNPPQYDASVFGPQTITEDPILIRYRIVVLDDN